MNKLIKNKKAVELSFQAIAILIISIIVLILIIYFFSDKYSTNTDSLSNIGNNAIDSIGTILK